MMAGMKTSYALRVIDMQLVAFGGKTTPPIIDGSQPLDKVSSLIDVCRAEDIPVIYLQKSTQRLALIISALAGSAHERVCGHRRQPF
jgi:hypothetical protein